MFYVYLSYLNICSKTLKVQKCKRFEEKINRSKLLPLVFLSLNTSALYQAILFRLVQDGSRYEPLPLQDDSFKTLN